MKKRNITFAILLIAVVLTAVGISGTYARYITSDSAVGITNIAKWSVAITGDGREDTGEERIIVPLEFDGNDYVATGVIAPGSTATGTLEVDLSGSEVAADIYVEVGDITINGTELTGGEKERFLVTLEQGGSEVEGVIHVGLDELSTPVELSVGLEWLNDDGSMDLDERVEYTWNEWDKGKGIASAEATSGHTKIEVELKVVVQQHVASDTDTHTS